MVLAQRGPDSRRLTEAAGIEPAQDSHRLNRRTAGRIVQFEREQLVRRPHARLLGVVCAVLAPFCREGAFGRFRVARRLLLLLLLLAALLEFPFACHLRHRRLSLRARHQVLSFDPRMACEAVVRTKGTRERVIRARVACPLTGALVKPQADVAPGGWPECRPRSRESARFAGNGGGGIEPASDAHRLNLGGHPLLKPREQPRAGRSGRPVSRPPAI